MKSSEEAKETPNLGALKKLTCAQLRSQLAKKGKETSGTKPLLLARLAAVIVGSCAEDPKSASEAFEKQLEQENRLLWRCIDKLKKFSVRELKDMLQLNSQADHGGPDVLRQRVADAILFGTLPLCSLCSQEPVVYRDGAYQCDGDLQWSKCTFRELDVERKEWKFGFGKEEEKEERGNEDGGQEDARLAALQRFYTAEKKQSKALEAHQWKAAKTRQLKAAVANSEDRQDVRIEERRSKRFLF